MLHYVTKTLLSEAEVVIIYFQVCFSFCQPYTSLSVSLYFSVGQTSRSSHCVMQSSQFSKVLDHMINLKHLLKTYAYVL